MTYAVLLVVACISFATLAWRDLTAAIVVFFALLPSYLLRFEIGPMGPIGPIPSTVLEIFALILVAIWLVRTRPNPRALWQQLGPWRIPLVLALVAALISVVIAPNTTAALGILKAYYLEPMLMFLVLLTTLKTPEDWRRIFLAILASGVALSIFGIVQYISGLGIPTPWDIERRVVGVFDYPNALGLFLAPLVSAAIVLFFTTQSRVLYLVSCILCLLAIILAKTEAALVAIPAALVITLWISAAPLRTKILTTVAASAVFIATFTLLPPVRSKLLLQDTSGQVRQATWSETAQLIADHPITGVGLSGYPTALAPYHDPTLYEIFQYPHNVVLNVWVEIGLIGLIGLITGGVLATKTAWQHRQDPLTLAVFAALATMIIHGLVDVPFFKNDLAMMTVALVGYLAFVSGWCKPNVLPSVSK